MAALSTPARDAKADNERMDELAELCARHAHLTDCGGGPMDESCRLIGEEVAAALRANPDVVLRALGGEFMGTQQRSHYPLGEPNPNSLLMLWAFTKEQG